MVNFEQLIFDGLNLFALVGLTWTRIERKTSPSGFVVRANDIVEGFQSHSSSMVKVERSLVFFDINSGRTIPRNIGVAVQGRS
jgi:hypothetical protein